MINIKKIKSEPLSDEIKLIKLLDELSPENGKISGFKLYEFEDALHISHTTCKKYLKMWRDAGALKFKFSGTILLNPDIFDFCNNDAAIFAVKENYYKEISD